MDPQKLKARFEAEGETAVREQIDEGRYQREELRLANEWLSEKAAERRRQAHATASHELAHSRLNTVIAVSGWLAVAIMVLIVAVARCTPAGG